MLYKIEKDQQIPPMYYISARSNINSEWNEIGVAETISDIKRIVDNNEPSLALKRSLFIEGTKTDIDNLK